MPALGIYANFRTGSLCGVEDQHRCFFHNAYNGEKKSKNGIKKQAGMVLPIFPKVSLGNNYHTIQEDK